MCVCSVHVAPTKVLDCEKEFEMKYFNSRVVHTASVRATLIFMHMMLGICRSIGFHCTWPLGFITITHFNEVASDRTTRSLRVMFHWESAKTATRWFSWECLEYQTGFTNRVILLVTLGSISTMFTETDSKTAD